MKKKTKSKINVDVEEVVGAVILLIPVILMAWILRILPHVQHMQ